METSKDQIALIINLTENRINLSFSCFFYYFNFCVTIIVIELNLSYSINTSWFETFQLLAYQCLNIIATFKKKAVIMRILHYMKKKR